MSERNGSPWPAPQSPPTRSLTWLAPAPPADGDYGALVRRLEDEKRWRPTPKSNPVNDEYWELRRKAPPTRSLTWPAPQPSRDAIVPGSIVRSRYGAGRKARVTEAGPSLLTYRLLDDEDAGDFTMYAEMAEHARGLTWGAPDPAKKADTATVEKTHAEMRGRTAYWQTWDATGGDEKEARRQKLIATLAPVPERADNPPTEGQRWSKAQTKPPAPPKPDDRFGDAYTWTAYTTSTDDPPAPKRVRAAAKYTAGQLRTYVGLQRIRFEKQGSWHAPWPERRLDAVNPLHSAKCQARGAWGNALVQKPTPGCKGCKALR